MEERESWKRQDYGTIGGNGEKFRKILVLTLKFCPGGRWVLGREYGPERERVRGGRMN